MHYRRLGNSGLKLSEISFGAWLTFGDQITEETAVDLLHAAYDQGVNFFDNADAYANGEAERVMGKAIKDLPRAALVISSKVFWPTMPGPNGRGLSRKHIFESVRASLKRLGTDYLDLYFCHRYDPDTPIEEVVRTMSDLIHQGYIMYWGTSEWTALQVSQAYAAARQYHLVPPTVEQPQYNLFHRSRVENDITPLCNELGLGLTTWSPLYSGILTGKYNDSIPDGSRAAEPGNAWLRDRLTTERILRVQQLTDLAQELGVTTAQLSIAWILRRKEVSSVITGATHAEQLDENLAAAEVLLLLDNEVQERIDSIIGFDLEDTD